MKNRKEGGILENNDKIVQCEIMLDRIFFPKRTYKVESGEFAIFSAKVINKIENCENLSKSWGDTMIKLKGNVCKLETDVEYKVHCKLCDTHDVYGDTYEILFINKKVDLSDKSKQMEFLEGILNPNIVVKLFNKYDNVVDLLETKNITELTTIKGIGHATAMRLIEEYEDSKDYSYIYTELHELNLTPTLIKKLLDHYKSPDIVVDIVKNNPYKLIEVSGVGFKKADELAQKMGMTSNDSRRVKACILHTLDENGEIGKSYLHYAELMNVVYNQIGFVEQEIINNVASDLIANGSVHVSNNGEYIGLTKYYKLEKQIHDELFRLINSKVKNDNLNVKDDWESDISKIEERQGFTFTDEQFRTIELAIKNNVLAVTGNAGVGKTATINGVVKILKNCSVSACALSGKASVRITEATGLEASTIHRLLQYQNGEFMYNKENPLATDVVIVDEATMVNGSIFLSLLRAIPNGAKLFMLGDWQQLTPIGNCQVFTDILNNSTIPISKLTKIHRQAEASGIITTSLKIAHQEQIFKSNFTGGMTLGELQDMELDIFKEDNLPSDRVIKHFVERYKITNDIMETQILVPMRLRGDLSTYNLNTKIQDLINPVSNDDLYFEVMLDKEKKYKIKLGDKVINTKNNYKAMDIDGREIAIFNGNMGIVKEIDYNTCVVDFIGIGEVILSKKGIKNLELGYAITIHKSQGSGFHTAIVGIDYSAYKLLNAEILYTGVTRAKKYCVLVGKNSAIRTAISKREVKNKQTYLNEFLKHE